MFFFFSSIRRHTRCALVTGVQTCARPISMEDLFGQFRSNLKNAQTLALYDPVTSLPNRTSFCRQVERLLAARPAGGHAALFFIDLDGFKMVNDTLGHAAGDLLQIGRAHV